MIGDCSGGSFFPLWKFSGPSRATTRSLFTAETYRGEINLHGTARSVPITLPHGFTIFADGVLHFVHGRQRVFADQVIRNPLAL